jgi:hypothetical protein
MFDADFNVSDSLMMTLPARAPRLFVCHSRSVLPRGWRPSSHDHTSPLPTIRMVELAAWLPFQKPQLHSRQHLQRVRDSKKPIGRTLPVRTWLQAQQMATRQIQVQATTAASTTDGENEFLAFGRREHVVNIIAVLLLHPEHRYVHQRRLTENASFGFSSHQANSIGSSLLDLMFCNAQECT